ncbi:MAG: hypothetical protein AB1714_11755 [Acidobacteriota bacterium]
MRSIPLGRIPVTFATYLLLCMPSPASAEPVITASDITVQEGNISSTTATFTLTRSETGRTSTVEYLTVPAGPQGQTIKGSGARGSGSDYIGTRGTLVFSPSERSKTISVQI